MSYTIEHIATWLNSKRIIHEPSKINHLLTDSRRLLNPTNTLFFALTSSHNDGHHYIADLIKAGVTNFVIHTSFDTSPFPNVNFLIVEDVLSALQQIAANHRAQFTYPVIGITGSNGKTIVKEWLNQLLTPFYHIIRSPRSYNSQIGVPLSIWEMSEKHQLALLEAGVSQKGEMQTLANIIQPNIGILTSIGTAHQDGFDSEKNKTNEKWILFNHANIIIAPLEAVQMVNNHFNENQKIITWSRTHAASLKIVNEEMVDAKTYLQASYLDATMTFILPFTDTISINNAITCILTLLQLNIPFLEIQNGINQLRHLDMRMQIKTGINHCFILNDSYSNDILSLKLALEYATQQKGVLPITLIMSDFIQLFPSPFQYEKLINLLTAFPIKKLIAIGPELSHVLKQNKLLSFVDVQLETYNTTSEYIHQIDIQSFKEEFILIKGARLFELEKINALLQLQVHQTKAEINLTALVHNYKIIKSTIGPQVKIMAMVKAFGYGSGSIELARILQFHQIDYLCVAYVDEGVELRKAGIHIPIMVMNVDASTFDTLIKYHLEPEIFSFSLYHQFEKYIIAQAIPIFPIHLKLNTGMNRLGFELIDIQPLCEMLKMEHPLKVQSIFSHLSASGQKDFDPFTYQQLDHFTKAAHLMETALGYTCIKHIANSGAIFMGQQLHLDMVRLGIGLFGITKATIPLEPVIQLTTTISQIRHLKKDETVGYNRAGVLARDSVIATVRLGYADGYPRKLGSGKGAMWVNGILAPTVGAICMDMTMIDITDIQTVKEGDTVQVFGKQLPVEQIAKWADTIPYEILTSIGQRVKRIYIED